MRKYVFIGFLMAIIAVMTGCKNDEPKFHTETLDLTVLHADWQFDDKAQQFYYSFSVPEITSKVYNYGNWTICREFNKRTRDAYQVALPMSMFMTDTISQDNVVYYTQYVDYRLGEGYVDIQLTNSDYLYIYDQGKIVNPEDMFFRLQLIY
jgi:hypothetical protein